jgi:hypothetical protein
MKTLDHRFRSAKPDGPDATQVQPSHWNDGHAFTGGTQGYTLVRDTSDPNYGATWRPDGIWIPVPFDPANYFTADAGVAWTVIGSGVQVHRYTIVGFTMRLHVAVSGTLTGSTSGLRLKMPTGYNLNAYGVSPAIHQQGGVNAHGYVLANPAFPNQLIISKLNNEAWSAGAVITYLTVTIEVVGA